jgi:CTP synthase (UTP-ammonia lyase)
MPRIAVVGDFDPDNATHIATVDALGHSATALGASVDVSWVPTESLDEGADPGSALAPFDAVVVAPGSPYRSMTGALAAIEHARRTALPLIGTCGGFQHLVIEFARNVLGLADVQHAEYDPYGSTLIVTPLTCSLAGQAMEVGIEAGTRAGKAYGTDRATERYYCNFGLNPDYVDDLVAAGLTVSGTDADGEVRIVELADHPFFVGTLFVPQARSTLVRPHPLVTAFVEAAGTG